MKLFTSSLALVTICIFSNSHAMENEKEQIRNGISLFDAQESLREANKIPGELAYMRAWKHFETPADSDKFKQQEIGKAFSCLDHAKDIAQAILDDNTADKITKDKALNILEQEKKIRAKDWENF